MPLPDKNLLYMIHHVFLPPKLPTTGDDPQAGNKDLSLLQTVKEALQGFQSHSGPGNIETIQAAGSMLEQLIRISDHHGWVQEAELVEAFKMLSSKGTLPLQKPRARTDSIRWCPPDFHSCPECRTYSTK